MNMFNYLLLFMLFHTFSAYTGYAHLHVSYIIIISLLNLHKSLNFNLQHHLHLNYFSNLNYLYLNGNILRKLRIYIYESLIPSIFHATLINLKALFLFL